MSREEALNLEYQTVGENEALRPWERQPGETDAQWAAFQVYRDLPPADRSLIAAYRQDKGQDKLRVSGHWQAWFKRNRWKERVHAYDRYRDAQIRAELEGRRLKTRLRIADQAEAMLKKAENALASFAAIDQRLGMRDGREVWVISPGMSPHEITRMFEVASKALMLALGEPTENVDHRHQGLVGVGLTGLEDLLEMDEEELETRIARLNAVNARLADIKQADEPAAETPASPLDLEKD